VHGALHAEALPIAYELILLAYPAFRVLTARRASRMQSARGRFPTLHVLGLLDQIERLQIAYEYGPGGRTHERGRRRLAAPLAMGCVHAFRAVTVLHG
jgi:hypothetical protein